MADLAFQPRAINYPSWQRLARVLGAALGLEATVFGVSLAFGLPDHWLSYAGHLRLVAALIPLTVPAYQVAAAFARRSAGYDDLFRFSQGLEGTLRTALTNQAVLKELVLQQSFPEITLTGVIMRNGRLCLATERTNSTRVGVALFCYSEDGGEPLGIFNVIEIADDRCVAEELNILAPIWWGLVHERAMVGNLGAPPDTRAVLYRHAEEYADAH